MESAPTHSRSIKSDADTYVRLSRQVRDYDRYCDGNYVVAGSTHGLHIGEHVPEWWGIITVEAAAEGPDFYVLREAGRNPNLDLKRKLGLLWRPELVHIQELNKLPGYKEKSKKFVVEKILEKVPADRSRRWRKNDCRNRTDNLRCRGTAHSLTGWKLRPA